MDVSFKLSLREGGGDLHPRASTGVMGLQCSEAVPLSATSPGTFKL
jgi:hypothetical protein